jgi:ADP-ribose pyrophosphatase YjhB (NUDIX family)
VQDRLYPERPIVGVLAVLRRSGRILLAQRAKPPIPGRWGFIGGVQELGETVKETAARELLEETGAIAEPLEVLTVLDAVDRDEAGKVRTHFTLVAVLVEWREGEPQPDQDAMALGWYTPEEAEAAGLALFPSTLRIMRLALGAG